MAILPYLGHEDLYKEFKLDEPWDSAHNKKLLARIPQVYAPPSGAAREPFTTFYQVFTGPGSVFEGKEPPSLAQIANAGGTANTLLAVEAGAAVPWTKPEDLSYVPGKPLPKLAGYNDTFPAAFVDGHVQSLPVKWFEKNAPLIINWMNNKPVALP